MKKRISVIVRLVVCVVIVFCISLANVATAGVSGLPSGANTTSVTTADGTYYIIMSGANAFNSTNGFAYNTVSLRKGSVELGYGYTTAGRFDILKNSADKIFVTGGGSTWDVMKLSTNYSYKLYAEKAELNVWVYENGIMNGLKAQKKFSVASVNGYSYFKSVMSGNTIKSTYVGEKSDGTYAVETFSFDTVSRTWGSSTEKQTITSLTALSA